MATALDLKDMTTCSICLSVFKKPKALPCLHSYCEDCLEDHIAKTESNGNFQCPLCDSQTAVPENGVGRFQDNFYLNTLIDSLSQDTNQTAEQQVGCDVCRFEEIQCPATSVCKDCSDKLCNDCAVVHKKTRLPRDHKVVSLDESSTNESCSDVTQKDKDIFCKDHPAEDLAFFCSNCNVCTCPLFKDANHLGHNIISPKEALGNISTEIDYGIESLKSSLSLLCNVRLVEIKNTKATHENDIKYLTTKVKQYFDRVRKEASIKENELMLKIKGHSDCIRDNLDSNLQEFSIMKEEANCSLSKAKQDFECENEIQRLNHFRCILEDISNTQSKMQGNEWYIYKPTRQMKCGNTPDFDVSISLDFTAERRNLSPMKQLPKASLVHEFEAKFEGEKNASCLGITYLDKEYYITGDNKQVKVFNYKGQFDGFLVDGQLENEYKLQTPKHVANDGSNVFVTDDGIKGVVGFHNKSVNKVMHNIYISGGRSSIAVDRSKVVICDKMQRLIVLDMDGQIQQVSDKASLRLQKFNPYSVTISHTGLIICTDYATECVHIMDSEGKKVLHTYKPTGDKALTLPYGICSDEWGHIIIADYDYYDPGCLHVISFTGEHLGMIVTKEDGLTGPKDVTICGPGLVAVVEYGGKVKVYKYLDLEK